MKLYPKKLTGVAALKQEKKRLHEESRRLEEEDFLTVKEVLGGSGNNKDKKDKKDKDKQGSLLDLLPISNPLVGQVVSIALSKLMPRNERPREAPRAEESDRKKEKSLVQKAAVEFIGGYLKWKAIELTYKSIRSLVKSRQEQKEAAATVKK